MPFLLITALESVACKWDDSVFGVNFKARRCHGWRMGSNKWGFATETYRQRMVVFKKFFINIQWLEQYFVFRANFIWNQTILTGWGLNKIALIWHCILFMSFAQNIIELCHPYLVQLITGRHWFGEWRCVVSPTVPNYMIPSSNGNIFRVTGHFYQEFTGHRWLSHNGQWRGALTFPLICFLKNGRVNNPETGDLIHYRAHYDVTVLWTDVDPNSRRMASLDHITLTHHSLVTPHGDMDLAQHCLNLRPVAWWHQTITRTTVDFAHRNLVWCNFTEMHYAFL